MTARIKTNVSLEGKTNLRNGLLENRAFIGLAGAQFLGTVNDHLFKMVVALAAITAAARFEGSEYLSLSGVLFVLPYLLFSGYAGRLADHYDKRSVIVVAKFAEILIMLLGAAALFRPNEIGLLLAVLFLMAAQSAFFSPSKYGYLPEIVPPWLLLRANGIVEASRYAAVIVGTLAGGILMEVWRDAPLRIGAIVVALAIAGFWFSLRTPPPKKENSAQAEPARGHNSLLRGLMCIARSPTLAIAVLGITVFESTAALALLDVVLLAKTDLAVEDGLAGLLPACAALGAGCGAYFCGRVTGGRVNLGLSSIAGVGLCVSLLVAAAAAGSYTALLATLFLTGASGGIFFLPFLTWLQKAARAEERGLVISTNNFVNMIGVLAASGMLWVFHAPLGLSPRAILVVCAASAALFVAITLALSRRIRISAFHILVRAHRRGASHRSCSVLSNRMFAERRLG